MLYLYKELRRIPRPEMSAEAVTRGPGSELAGKKDKTLTVLGCGVYICLQQDLYIYSGVKGGPEGPYR